MFQFTAPIPAIPFTGVLGRGDDQDLLKERFKGSFWKKFPENRFPNVRYMNDSTRNLQLTLLLDSHGHPIEFAVYTERFVDFKIGFGTVTLDCTYHAIDPIYKHMGLQVVEVLKHQNLW